MYTEYSFIGIVDGEPMEFVSEEEYLEYINSQHSQSKRYFQRGSFTLNKKIPTLCIIAKYGAFVKWYDTRL